MTYEARSSAAPACQAPEALRRRSAEQADVESSASLGPSGIGAPRWDRVAGSAAGLGRAVAGNWHERWGMGEYPGKGGRLAPDASPRQLHRAKAQALLFEVFHANGGWLGHAGLGVCGGRRQHTDCRGRHERRGAHTLGGPGAYFDVYRAISDIESPHAGVASTLHGTCPLSLRGPRRDLRGVRRVGIIARTAAECAALGSETV